MEVKRGYSFSLTLEQFKSFWGKPCYYCGGEIEGIGIDRIDNTMGYEINNCVPCCIDCNKMKMTQTLNEFINRCKVIANKF